MKLSVGKTVGVALMGVSLSLASVGQAKADSFAINQCWSSCDGLNTTATVATLSIVQNGANVDFTLTNSVSNLGAAAVLTGTNATIISFFDFTYIGDSLSLSDFFGITGGATGTFGMGTHTEASLTFNLDLDLPPPPGQTPDLFTNGESISWTVANDLVSNFTKGLGDPPQDQFLMVHIQRLADGGSTKYVNGDQGGNVPEPSTLLLLGTGLIGMCYLGRRNQKDQALSL